jgi:hypothetical protein
MQGGKHTASRVLNPNLWMQGGGDAAACRLLQGGARHLQHGAQPRACQQRVHGAHLDSCMSAQGCIICPGQQMTWNSNRCKLDIEHPYHTAIKPGLTRVTLGSQDEDLMPHAFGMDVDDHFVTVGGSTKCLAALSLAEDRLGAGPPPTSKPAGGGSRQRAAGDAAAQVDQQSDQLQGQQAGGQQHTGQALRAALQARLRFRRQFQQVRHCLHRGHRMEYGHLKFTSKLWPLKS